MLKRRLRRCEYQCACPDCPPVAQPPIGRDCGEDHLFSTVFLGSGLLFLAMLFMGAVNSTGLLAMIAGPNPNADLFRIRSQQRPDV
jgi:hypothetical protein